MVRKMKKLPIFLFLVVFLALSFSMSQNISTVQAQTFPFLLMRGRDFEKWRNADGSITHVLGVPVWVWSDVEGKYVPYIIDKNTWLSEGYASIQCGLIGSEFHKGKVVYYDPTLTRLAVERENWLVFKWNDIEGKWKPVCASLAKYFDSASIYEGEDYVDGTLTWTTAAGNLTIRYHFRERLKHTVWWTPTSNGKFALVQVWNGTQYNKVKLANATVIRRTDDVIVGKADAMTVLFFSDAQPFGILEDQNRAEAMFHHVMFAGGTVTWQGISLTNSVGWIFYNSTLCALSQGESLTVDPDTFTEDNPTEDARIRKLSEIYTRLDDPMVGFGSIGSEVHRGFVEWDVSSIPDSATVTDTIFKYHGLYNRPDNAYIYSMSIQPSTSSDSDVWNHIGTGNAYLSDSSTFPVVAENQEVDLGSQADTDLETQLSSDWFAIGLKTDGYNDLDYFADQSRSPATPKPTLYVTYITNYVPTNDACDATPSFYINTYGWVNITVTDQDGVADLKTVDVQIFTGGDTENFVLRWNETSDTFSEVSDSDNICTLDTSTSDNSTVDADTVKISFYFKLTGGAKGACDVKATSTDDQDAQDVDTYTGKFTYENSAPTIGEFQMNGTVTSDQYYYLNTTINDPDGVDDFDYAQVELSHDVILKWKRVGDVFNIQYDPNLYCVLDASGSFKTSVNSTAYKITWRMQLAFYYPAGSIDIIATNTKVVDNQAASGSNSQSGLFTFQKGTTYSDTIGPFDVESSSSINTPKSWDDTVGILTFNTTGNIVVEVGTYHSPSFVEVDDVEWTDWVYSATTENVTIRGVASKVELIWQSYKYTFKGPFSEDTGYQSGDVNVTCFSFNGETQTFELNGTNPTYILNLTYEPYCFYFDFPKNRTYFPLAKVEYVYVFENASLAKAYSLTLKDLVGFIEGDTYLETRRTVNSTLRPIERVIIDPLEPVEVILQVGRVYEIALKKDSMERVIGSVLANEDYEKTITIVGVSLDPRVKLAYKYILVDAYRESNPEKITIVYEDKLKQTISVFFEIQYMNGTQIWNSTITSNSGSVTWDQANATIDYLAKATIDHQTLHGSYLTFREAVPSIAATDYPFDVAVLGTLPISTKVVIPMGLVIAVAAVFSTLTAGAGLVLTVLTAGIFYYIGWLNIELTTLTICISLAIVFAIMHARRKEHY